MNTAKQIEDGRKYLIMQWKKKTDLKKKKIRTYRN